MNWTYRFDARALKELKKLDRKAAQDILTYLDERVASNADPRRFGKPLKGNFSGLWHYRVNNYRILCQIQDQVLVVLVVFIGHRKNIYG